MKEKSKFRRFVANELRATNLTFNARSAKTPPSLITPSIKIKLVTGLESMELTYARESISGGTMMTIIGDEVFAVFIGATKLRVINLKCPAEWLPSINLR